MIELQPRISLRATAFRQWLLIAITFTAAIITASLPRVAQSLEYHRFADERSFLSIPNFLNAVSNLAFVVTGAIGLWLLHRQDKVTQRLFHDLRERWIWQTFFAATILVGAGSAYYHVAPDNTRLVWDRLPMTLAFMSLLAGVIAERLSLKAGLTLLPLLLLVGAGSVWYWYQSELNGRGDLRFYGFVQFYPLLVIPLLLWLFPARYSQGWRILAAISCYLPAKIAEHLDAEIFALTYSVSGHTLKHLLAARAVFEILRMLQRRRTFANPLRTDLQKPETMQLS